MVVGEQEPTTGSVYITGFFFVPFQNEQQLSYHSFTIMELATASYPSAQSAQI